MKTIVLPASGEVARPRRRRVIEHRHLACEVVEHGAVMRLGEKADDVGRHVLADAVDVEELGAGPRSPDRCAASISSRQRASER